MKQNVVGKLTNKYKIPGLLSTVSTGSATSGTSLVELSRRKEFVN